MHTQFSIARPRRPRTLVALLAVVAVAASACTSTPAPVKWPTAGEAKDTLTTKYHYNFVPYTDRYRAANSSLQFQITVPQDLSLKKNMMVAVYNTPNFMQYSADIDNVFNVIAPDALAWAHDEEKKAGGSSANTNFQEDYLVTGGSITCSWNPGTPALMFIFNGYDS